MSLVLFLVIVAQLFLLMVPAVVMAMNVAAGTAVQSVGSCPAQAGASNHEAAGSLAQW
jgi:hypothetical protein